MKNYLFFFLSMILLAHCGKEDTPSSSTADDLTGTWEAKCQQTEKYMTIAFTASNNKDASMQMINYGDDATCTTEVAKMTMVYTYKIGAAVTDGKALDLTLVSCDPADDGSDCTKGAVMYTKYKINGNKFNLGSASATADGKTAEKRFEEFVPFDFTKK